MSTEIKDKPQVQTAGLRKFNKAEAQVKKVVDKLTAITIISTSDDLANAMSTLKVAKDIEKAIESKRTELVKPLNDEVKRINAFAKTLTADLTTAIDGGKKLVIAYNQEEERKAKKVRLDNRIQQLVSLGMVPQLDAKGQVTTYAYQEIYISLFHMENAPNDDWSLIYNETLNNIQLAKNKDAEKLHSELEEALFFSSEDEVEEIKTKIQEVAESPVVETMPVFSPSFSGVKGATKRWTHEVTDATKVPSEYLMVDEKKIREAIATGVREIPGVRIFQADGLTIR